MINIVMETHRREMKRGGRAWQRAIDVLERIPPEPAEGADTGARAIARACCDRDPAASEFEHALAIVFQLCSTSESRGTPANSAMACVPYVQRL